MAIAARRHFTKKLHRPTPHHSVVTLQHRDTSEFRPALAQLLPQSSIIASTGTLRQWSSLHKTGLYPYTAVSMQHAAFFFIPIEASFISGAVEPFANTIVPCPKIR
ncbi:hypothetical protein MN608_06445 [Microdochium nivale]|nr:hypothetical protein MN608_06445 [Microdochium nivale]